MPTREGKKTTGLQVRTYGNSGKSKSLVPNMSRRNLAFPDDAWAVITALANLPATLPGKRGDVPVSDTERLRAALHRLAELARNPKSATARERELVAELVQLFAAPRVRGGSRAGGFEAGNQHNSRGRKDG